MAHSPVFIGSQVCIALVGPEIHTLSATPSAGLVLVVLSAVTTMVVIVFVVIVVLPRRSLLCFLLSVLFFLLYRWPQCKSWLISGRCR